MRVIALIFALTLTVVSPALAVDQLLYESNFVYLGAFKVPLEDSGAPDYIGMSYGGFAIAYNSTNNSLFIASPKSQQLVGEISIPTLVNTTNLASLNRATFLQNLSDITEGNRQYINAGRTEETENNVYIGGLLKYGSSLIGSVYNYYDGASTAVYSHFTSGTTLASTGDFVGMLEVGVKPTQVPQAGFVGGYMADIPDNWQTPLGGTVLTGAGGYSVMVRTSAGPALFAFDPADLNMSTSADAVPLIYYNLTDQNCVETESAAGGHVCDNQNIGSYYSSETLYKAGTSLTGAVFPEGSRSVIVTGKYGTGESCYGGGNTTGQAGGEARTTNVSNAEMITWMNNNSVDEYPCGSLDLTRAYLTGNAHQCCYDPASSDLGAHAYPYVAYAWAYDAEDLARVKTGGRIVDDPSPNLATAIVENEITLRPGVSPTSTDTYKPWHIKPYATWQFDFPFTTGDYSVPAGATAYDAEHQIVYIVQTGGEDWSYPVIHAYQVRIGQSLGTVLLGQ